MLTRERCQQLRTNRTLCLSHCSRVVGLVAKVPRLSDQTHTPAGAALPHPHQWISPPVASLEERPATSQREAPTRRPHPREVSGSIGCRRMPPRMTSSAWLANTHGNLDVSRETADRSCSAPFRRYRVRGTDPPVEGPS